MKYSIFLLIFSWFLLNPFTGVAQISVHFQAKATVAGSKIVLADIAEIKPPGAEATAIGQLPIAAAPTPGKSKDLYVVTVINSLLKQPGVANVDWQGSQTITVKREAQTLTQEQLKQIVADYLVENTSKLPKGDVRFTSMRAPRSLTLPAGKLSWKVTPSQPGIVGSRSFSIALFVDGAPAGSCIVRGRLETLAMVVTAATKLSKGEVLTEENVLLQRQDIGGIDNPFTTKEEVLGKLMTRTLKTGMVLKQGHVVLPPVIKEGEMVKIVVQKGTLQLSTSGIAKADGRIGESILVKNISSNKMIHCRVNGPGNVSVEF